MANETFIKRVKLEGYKSIRSAEITFQPGLNIIIGKNGGGKTNCVKLIDKAIRTNYSELDNDFYLEMDVFNRKYIHIVVARILSSKNEEVQNFSLKKKQIKAVVQIDEERKKEFNRLIGDELPEIREYLYENRILLNNKFLGFSLSENLLLVSNAQEVRVELSDEEKVVVSISLDNYFDSDLPKRVINTLAFVVLDALTDDLKVEILETLKIEIADKLNALLFDLKTNLEKFSPIESIRFGENINMYKDNKEVIFNNLFLEFKINGFWYPFSSLSDGTKRIFYIISEVTSFKGVILLEEPELGIHPHQLHLLMTFLKEQSEDKQIIITTHSPQVLNILSKDELDKIIICEMTGNGTKMRHLNEKQKAKARKYMEQDSFLSDYWVYSDLEPHTL